VHANPICDRMPSVFLWFKIKNQYFIL
jgi:hypothetical protein